jgi:formylglycine-generating enzyme required for sulfatase activity
MLVMKSTLGKEERMVQYLDFDLEILEKGKGRSYEAHVLRSPAGEARAIFTLPFDRKDLDLVRASIEKAVLRRTAARAARRHSTPEVAQLHEFGETLFARLMVNSVRDCYSRSCDEAQKTGCGLRLKLRLPPALGQVPWEFLYSRSDGDFLNLSIYRPIVRYLELPHLPVESLCVPAPLRLLAVIASPKSPRLAALDVAREKQVLQKALADLVQRGMVALDFLEGPDTFRQLTRRLRRETYHVLHFVGHGGYDGRTQEGVLVMENEQGGEAWAGSENLGRLLRDVLSTRLVFLNACQGAVTSEADLFSSLAGALVRAGVPAVVAMQFEITDAAAILLAQEFYTALAENLPVDAALAEARKQIAFEDPDSLEWATPVLFMRVADGRLFTVAAAAATAQPAETPGPARTVTPPVTPVPPARRLNLEEAYTRALADYHLGRWAKAVEGFQAVVEVQPDYEDAADKLARAQLQAQLADLYAQAEAASTAGEWAAAIHHLETLTARQADYRNAAARLQEARRQKESADLYAEARRLHSAKEWPACLSALQRLHALAPGYPDPDGLRASAEKEQATQEQTQKLAALYRQGLKALDDQQGAEAVECFRQIQAVDPGYREVAQLLAQAQAEVLRSLPLRLIRPVDGQEMVLIPAGEFLMGSTGETGDQAYDDEKPQHKVSLEAYYIDRTPIANAQYARFIEAQGYDTERFWTPDGWAWRQGKYKPDLSYLEDKNLRQQVQKWIEGRKVEERKQPYFWKDSRWNMPGHPVVGINWFEAMAYCQWLNEQLHVPGATFQVQRDGRKEAWNVELGTWNIRLPTETEWEKAARGADGRRWPWGNEFDPQRCNCSESGKRTTTPVGAYSPAGDSPYDVADMAGNVWDWCRSLYKPYPYRADDGREDPQAAGTRVLRGGSWYFDQGGARCAARSGFDPGGFLFFVGFRVVFSPN